MYILARIKQTIPTPTPTYTELFNITNSEIADVNGDYHEVIINGIDRENYDSDYAYWQAVGQYLSNHGEIFVNSYDEIYTYIYTNEKCYIYDCDESGGITYIIPKGGGFNTWYYKSVAGTAYISDMSVDPEGIWRWKADPVNDTWSNDWSNKNILQVTSYTGNKY